MPRACKTCGRVVAEAAFCPFCAQPTVEHTPARLSQSDALTFRELCERKKRSDMGFVLCSFLILFVGMVSVTLLNTFLNVSLAFLVVPIIAFVAISIRHGRLSAIRCPRCKADLGQPDHNIRYCPFCGVDLEVEIIRKSLEAAEFLKEECEQRKLEIKKESIQLSPAMRKGNTEIRLPPGKEEKETGEGEKGKA